MIRLMGIAPTLSAVAFMFVIRTLPLGTPALRLSGLGLAVLSTGCIWLLARAGKASPIAKGMAGFVLLGAAGLWLWPRGLGQAIATNPMTWLYGVLLAVAVCPQLFGREPFTSFFARQEAPEAVWQTSVFRDITRNMAWGWAGLFALTGLLTLVPDLWPQPLKPAWLRHLFTDLLPLALMLGAGVPFNRRYPAYYQRRLGLEPQREPTQPPKPPSKEKTMSGRYKVVAVNGSPHQAIGNTAQMIAMLRPHLESAGFELEEIFLSDKNIRFCTGCGVCLEKGACWIRDDHKEIATRVLEADALILATPVYFFHVTAQMKTFIDRSLAYGHKPRTSWKPGLAVSVSAGLGETTVAAYLGNVMRAFGGYCAGSLTAIGIGPGEFVGKEAVEARAADLAADLVRAVKEHRRYPATELDLRFWQFMGSLVKENREFMKHDYEHWQKSGLFESFEAYVQQKKSESVGDPEARKAWVKSMIAQQKAGGVGGTRPAEPPRATAPLEAATCRELLQSMPHGFKPAAAQGFSAVYQFEVEDEGFTAHLRVAGGRCTYHDGPAEKPDVLIRTPGKVWLAIARGELDGQQAFMSGKYRVEGDIGRLIKISELFGSAKEAAA